MGLSAAVGHFSTGTGAVNSTVSVSGLGFQPKVLLCWWSGRTETADTTARRTHMRGYGCAVGSTSRWYVASGSQDTPTTMVAKHAQGTDACVAIFGTTPTAIDGKLDFTSFDAGGFTLTVTDAFTASFTVSYLVLGGTDITNVAAGSFQSPLATGTQDQTAPGFQPDFLLLAASGQTTNDGTVGADSACAVGFASGSAAANQVVWSGGSNDGSATSVANGYCTSGQIGVGWAAAMTSLNIQFALNAWLSSGFQLNYTVVPAAQGWINYLAIKGGRWSVGDLLTATSLTTVAETGVGFTPSALLALSAMRAKSTAGTVSAHDQWSLGAATDATHREAQATVDQNAAGTAVTGSSIYVDELYINLTTAAAMQGLMDLQSLDADGFTAIMDDADPAQEYVAYVAVAPGAVATNRDAASRLRLLAATFTDAAARLRLRVFGAKDTGVRLRLALGNARDTANRLRLLATTTRDAAARLRLSLPNAKDAAARLGLRQAASKDAPSRLRVRVFAAKDGAARLRVFVPASKDATARLRLLATTARDAAAHVRLAVPSPKDASARLRLRQTAFRDAAGRLRLLATTTRDAAARLRLSARAVRETGARLRLIVGRVPIGAHGMIYPGWGLSLKTTAMDAARDLGARVIRFDCDWDSIESSVGVRSFTDLDQSISLAQARGMLPLLTVAWTPGWSATHRYDPPGSFTDWTNFLTALATRYAGQGILYEIWNEPDLSTAWSGTAAQYAQLHSLAYDAIKAADPTARVLNGGLSSSAAPGDAWVAAAFGDPTYPITAKTDIANVHIRGTATWVVSRAAAWKSATLSQGFSTLWVTEFGYPADSTYQSDPSYATGEVSQSDYYQATAKAMLAQGLDFLLITLHDDFHTGQFASEGLVTLTGTRRYSFTTVQSLILPWRSVPARLTLLARTAKDSAARVRLLQPSMRDAASRLRVRVLAVRDVSARLRLARAGARDVSARFRQRATTARDAGARLVLQALGQRLLDSANRLRLSAKSIRDTAGRLRLFAARTMDAASRLALRASAGRDTATRLRLLARTSRDSAARVRLLARRSTDASARLVLRAVASADARGRLALRAATARDGAARLKLSAFAQATRDGASRLRLWAHVVKDVVARLALWAAATRAVGGRLHLRAAPQLHASLSASVAADSTLAASVALESTLSAGVAARATITASPAADGTLTGSLALGVILEGHA